MRTVTLRHHRRLTRFRSSVADNGTMRKPANNSKAADTLRRMSRHEFFPATLTLAAVALFWIAAAVGGLQLLSVPHSALVTLAWLYLMLFLITASLAAAFLALRDLVFKIRRRRSGNWSAE